MEKASTPTLFHTLVFILFTNLLLIGQVQSQSIMKDVFLGASCTEVFKEFVKPGHVINFESADEDLDGKFMLIKKERLQFEEVKSTPRSSTKLSLKRIPSTDFISVRNEKGILLTKLKVVEGKKGEKEVECS